MVPKGGLEPPRVAPYAPQTYVSTSSTTSAFVEKFPCRAGLTLPSQETAATHPAQSSGDLLAPVSHANSSFHSRAAFRLRASPCLLKPQA